jgi:hypothetical protein
MVLINMSESLYWEVMPLQGTKHWRDYIKTACEIGLEEQPQELGGSLASFLGAFHVNGKQHDLSIMVLINMSESLYWEVMPLQGTKHWRGYIKTACEIGLPVMLFIQVVHKAGSSSQFSILTPEVPTLMIRLQRASPKRQCNR